MGDRVEEIQREYAVLFNVAVYKQITVLAPQAARLLIAEPVKDLFKYEDQAIDHIMEITGGHAYYTQLTAHSLFNLWEQSHPDRITVDDVQAVLLEVVERGTVNLKFVWDRANSVEKLVMTAMAELLGDRIHPVDGRQIKRALEARRISLPIGEIEKALGNLVVAEAVAAVGGYTFAVDLMRLYIREYQRIEWVQEELSKDLEEMRAAGVISVEAPKRPIGVRAIVFASSALVIGVILGALLVPASPMSIIPSSEPPLLSVTASTPTPTPIPPTPTPTPIPPPPGLYAQEKCSLPPVEPEIKRAFILVCVESVLVNPGGQMRFDVSWEPQIEEGLIVDGQLVNALAKLSDEGNTNMYVIDDRGNRYDFVDLGGAAREETVIPTGEKATGWFLFSPPQDKARRFTFLDDDRDWAIAGIVLPP